MSLNHVAKFAGWATPTGRDHKDGASTLENTPINGLLGRQVSLSTAPMVRRGQLDPTLVRWLQGYPPAWAYLSPAQRRLAAMAGIDGASLRRAKASRIGSLRALGNSICPQVAAAFIRAYIGLPPVASFHSAWRY